MRTPVALALIGVMLATASSAQIIVPDRLPGGQRKTVLTTPVEWGTLAFDSLHTLPADFGGRDNWWHQHALFESGNVDVALDPVLDLTAEWRYHPGMDGAATVQRGHRNVRGVRYAGQVDDALRFGGTVLEMQRLLVGPDAEYVAATGHFPGMGPGKVRPAEGGMNSIDHSLAEVWFDAQPARWIRVQWGMGASGMGPGIRNLLWHAGRAPAPYLLLEADLGRGWTYRWAQSRQRGRQRLAADGAREGRYHPLALGIRSLTKTWTTDRNEVALSVVTARWTDVLNRGVDRPATLDWAAAMAPWSWPRGGATTTWNLAGHDGVDFQWRRPRSTWYGQFRLNPRRVADPMSALDLQTPRHQFMAGHVRHGERWTVWTEWAPTRGSMSGDLDPNLPDDLLGIQDASPWRTSWRQGAEWRWRGWTLATEWARLHDGSWSWKNTLSAPSVVVDSAPFPQRKRRATRWPNRWWPAFVPWSPVISNTSFLGTNTKFWSMGVSGPLTLRRQTH